MTFYDIFISFLREQMVHDDFDKIIDDKEKGYEVIINFLKTHNKEEAFPVTGKFIRENSYRFNHILETFTIGWKILNEHTVDYIFKDYFKDGNKNNHYYINDCWLMTSLLHDSAYFYEKNYESNKIKTYLSKFYNNQFVKPTYSIDTLDRYYKMIECHPFCEEERHEHGIVGAIASYNSLSSNWYRNVKMLGGLDEAGQALDRNKCILYKKTDLKHFQIVCKAIAQHNVYKCISLYDNRRSYYAKFELRELMDSNTKINIADTLTYLLSIVDTIEFTKRFCKDGQIKPSEVAKRLDIDFAYPRIGLHYSRLIGFVPDEILNKYIGGIVELSDWLDVRTDSNEEDKSIFITFILI